MVYLNPIENLETKFKQLKDFGFHAALKYLSRLVLG